MSIVLLTRHVKLTILTTLGFHHTIRYVSIKVFGFEFSGAILALLIEMELLLVLLQEIFIKHLPARRTFDDISSAVAKVCSRF